uniref:Uncharacterized protein n=1 Tax=Bubo bubo TaxID=30461 RepID=A0A8C0FKK5_BUBBB
LNDLIWLTIPSLVYMYMYTYTHTHTHRRLYIYRRSISQATGMCTSEMLLTVCIYLQYHIRCITYHVYNVSYLPSLASIHCDLQLNDSFLNSWTVFFMEI